ncbi:hypothetical protein CCR80_03315 [Rhodothalassium salexigens]|uniref:glycerophosphodiester phosphodiesterase family protein n=1 Tax=Rhodothalassium salexigens TaxID=1086 RepID=UPI0019122091|nr:glycerophosphodiester phosphodiesterase family protein [Rhodothalassium salexigens]MBK5920069.1 hypothetical protein [Rhodothalassium salexigens]
MGKLGHWLGGLALWAAGMMVMAQDYEGSVGPWPYPTLTGAAPLVIAHRGASGYLPEHTLEAYALAIELGADFIEPDLVMTRDGHLVVRHDSYLSTTTDVADRPEFADRRTTRGDRTDWFVDDFSLAEIKTLKARQAFPGRDRDHDDRYEIPSFAEVLRLAAGESARRGRPVGVYPETKHPGHFAARGLDMAQPLLDALATLEALPGRVPVFIQSFEPEILDRLKAASDWPLIVLVYPVVGADGTVRPSVSLERAATVAEGVGPAEALLVDATGADTGFVARAHAAGLAVHPWTHRLDQVPQWAADGRAELRRLYALGIDGIFSDFTDAAVSLRALDAGAWAPPAAAARAAQP